MCVGVYGTLLDTKFAAFRTLHAEGQWVTKRWGRSLLRSVVLGDSGKLLHAGRFLTVP